jgi:hypothetical protein
MNQSGDVAVVPADIRRMLDEWHGWMMRKTPELVAGCLAAGMPTAVVGDGLVVVGETTSRTIREIVAGTALGLSGRSAFRVIVGERLRAVTITAIGAGLDPHVATDAEARLETFFFRSARTRAVRS